MVGKYSSILARLYNFCGQIGSSNAAGANVSEAPVSFTVNDASQVIFVKHSKPNEISE